MQVEKIGCFDVYNKTWFRIYYPSEKGSYPPMRWLPHKEHATGLAIFVKKTWLSGLFNFMMRNVFITDSQLDAPLTPLTDGKKYPVIIFSHGLAGNRSAYSCWISGMVRLGFVVLAIEHSLAHLNAQNTEPQHYQPYDIEQHETEFEFRHSQLLTRKAQMENAIVTAERLNEGEFNSSFKDQLDVSEFTAAGHSYGSCTSMFTACYQPKITKLMLMDPWMMPLGEQFYKDWKRKVPTIIVNADKFHWPENLKSMHEFTLKNGAENTKSIFLENTKHQDFSDFPVHFPLFLKFSGTSGKNGGMLAINRTLELMKNWLQDQGNKAEPQTPERVTNL